MGLARAISTGKISHPTPPTPSRVGRRASSEALAFFGNDVDYYVCGPELDGTDYSHR